MMSFARCDSSKYTRTSHCKILASDLRCRTDSGKDEAATQAQIHTGGNNSQEKNENSGTSTCFSEEVVPDSLSISPDRGICDAATQAQIKAGGNNSQENSGTSTCFSEGVIPDPLPENPKAVSPQEKPPTLVDQDQGVLNKVMENDTSDRCQPDFSSKIAGVDYFDQNHSSITNTKVKSRVSDTEVKTTPLAAAVQEEKRDEVTISGVREKCIEIRNNRQQGIIAAKKDAKKSAKNDIKQKRSKADEAAIRSRMKVEMKEKARREKLHKEHSKRLYIAEKNLEARTEKFKLKRNHYSSIIKKEKIYLDEILNEIEEQNDKIKNKKEKIKNLKDLEKQQNFLSKIDTEVCITKSKLKKRKLQRHLGKLKMQKKERKKKIEKYKKKLKYHLKYYGTPLAPRNDSPTRKPTPSVFFSDGNTTATTTTTTTTEESDDIFEIDPSRNISKIISDDVVVEDLTDSEDESQEEEINYFRPSVYSSYGFD